VAAETEKRFNSDSVFHMEAENVVAAMVTEESTVSAETEKPFNWDSVFLTDRECNQSDGD